MSSALCGLEIIHFEKGVDGEIDQLDCFFFLFVVFFLLLLSFSNTPLPPPGIDVSLLCLSAQTKL